MIFSVGQVVVKIAGRDAGKIGVITEVLDNRYVMLAGEIRKRKCNIKHLELTAQQVTLPARPTDDQILAAVHTLQLPFQQKSRQKRTGQAKTPKTKTAKLPRPRRLHKQKTTATQKATATPAAKAPQQSSEKTTPKTVSKTAKKPAQSSQ